MANLNCNQCGTSIPDDYMESKCPYCGKSLQKNTASGKRSVMCTKCGKTLIIPIGFKAKGGTCTRCGNRIDFAQLNISIPSQEQDAPMQSQSNALENKLGTYQKTAPGELLTYRPTNIMQYAGSKFCLRITLGQANLDTCFFAMLPENLEQKRCSDLFNLYFNNPQPEQIQELETNLNVGQDITLPKKYETLRTLFSKVQEGKYSVKSHINNGLDNISLQDTISQHLATGTWNNGMDSGKILDMVLDFKQIMPFFGPAPEQEEWIKQGETDVSSTQWSSGQKVLATAGVGLVLLGGWYFFIRKSDYQKWSQTDAALGHINLDDVFAAFQQTPTFKDFCSKVNKIYEGHELILVQLRKNSTLSNDMTVEGWADIDDDKNVKKEKDEKLFTIEYKSQHASVKGFGANSYYQKSSYAKCSWDLNREQMNTQRTGGHFYYFHSSPGYWSGISSDRSAYRTNQTAYDQQLKRNGEYGEKMQKQYGSQYDSARKYSSEQRQGFMAQQKTSGGFKNTYAHSVGGTSKGGSFVGGGI